MAKRLSLEVAKTKFQRKSAVLLARGNLIGLRELFGDLTASTAPQEGDMAIEAMVEELPSILLAPNRRVQCNVFDDIT